jgi:ParB/RepB/Spo0J family partition protein
MTVTLLRAADPLPERAELVPRFFESPSMVTPDGNPVYTAAQLADLLASIREHGQLVPGWVCPSPDLPDGKRLCLEGNRRLAVCLMLGLPFWAFDLGRAVPEAERITLTFQHNHSRRVMKPDEIAERAARYMEITGATQADTAKHLNISPPTLSRAFGERRISPELRDRADRLGFSIRALIATLPPGLMARSVEFAEGSGPDGKKPTRDQVAAFNRQLTKTGKPAARKAKSIPLRHNGRTVSITVGERESAATVAEDLKALAAKLGKLTEVEPAGWIYHFQ